MIDNEKTLSRRSLLDWLGKATVLGLGSQLAAGCSPIQNILADGGGHMDDDTGNTNDGGGDIGDSGKGDSGENSEICIEPDNSSFSPGEEIHKVYDGWEERTVDTQDLKQILDSWRLKVDGLVENPANFSFTDLLKLPRQDQVTDFHCAEGWSILDVPWNGVHLKTLFEIVKPLKEATHVTFHTLGDTYNESLPIDVALESKTLLAYGIDCATLPLKHGFPLRLVIPRLWAYKSAKYVYRIELDDKQVLGYWSKQGSSYEAEVPEDKLRPGKY